MLKQNGIEIVDGKAIIKPGDKIELPEARESLNAAEAMEHYINGDGQDLVVPFDSVHTSGIKAEDYPSIRSCLQVCEPGTYEIEETQPRKIVNSTDAFGYGILNVTARGTLTIDDDGNYDFAGTYSSSHDLYNFDSKYDGADTVDWLREVLSLIGRQIPGKPYYIYSKVQQMFTQVGIQMINKQILYIFFVSILSLLSCKEDPPINETRAEVIANVVLEDYCKAEGYDCKNMKPSPISTTCKCLDKSCKEKVCKDGPVKNFDKITNGWFFNFEYTGKPKHKFSVLVGVNGGIDFSGVRVPKNFGRTGYRLDYNKYRSLAKQQPILPVE